MRRRGRRELEGLGVEGECERGWSTVFENKEEWGELWGNYED